jgi:hypothetical protein
MLDNLMTVFYYLEVGSTPTQPQGEDVEVIDYKVLPVFMLGVA